MADLALSIQATGLQELVRRNLAMEAFPIDLIKFGRGQYTPSGIETDIMTPFSPVKEFTNPAGSVSGNTLQFVFEDPSANVYNIGEIGVFSGTFMLGLISRPSSEGWVLQKSNNPLVVPASYQFNATLPSVISFAVANTHPLATELITGLVKLSNDTEADDDTNDTTAISPKQLHRIEDVLRAEISAGDAGSINVDRLPVIPASKIDPLMATDAELAAGLALKLNVPTVRALTDAANINWNWTMGEIGTVTLGGNRSLNVPLGGSDNQVYLLRVTQDTTGSRTLTLHNSIDRGALSQPSLSTTAGDTDVLGFIRWGATVRYLGILKGY